MYVGINNVIVRQLVMRTVVTHNVMIRQSKETPGCRKDATAGTAPGSVTQETSKTTPCLLMFRWRHAVGYIAMSPNVQVEACGWLHPPRGVKIFVLKNSTGLEVQKT